MGNQRFAQSQRMLSCTLLILVPVILSCGSGSSQEPESSIGVVLPILPSDTLPPTNVLLRSQPPVGLSSLPTGDATDQMAEAKVNLGRRLFFDPILSQNETVSCASCHQPSHGLASPEAIAIGIDGKRGRRNAPSIFNRGYGRSQFWDGRAASLEEQSLQPLSNPDEMGDNLERILKRLREHPEYPAEFTRAFGPKDTETPVVEAEQLAAALAAFQRCLLLGDSPVDRFRAADVTELSLEARQGLWIFESRGRCWQCHSGENLTDEKFHNTGVGFGSASRDLGRAEITHDPQDRYRFKTPSLRGVNETSPYMHDGSIKSLEDVVEFYSRGGAPDDPELSPLIRPLNLSDEERRYLVEFLRALSPARVESPTQ